MAEDIIVKCACGRECTVIPSDGSTLRCGGCGRLVSVPSKEADPGKRDSLDKFIEATFELLNEVDGAFPTSGAR